MANAETLRGNYTEYGKVFFFFQINNLIPGPAIIYYAGHPLPLLHTHMHMSTHTGTHT